MNGVDGLLAVLDTRAFTSAWYWLLLAGIWSYVGRGALGIPSELVRHVRRNPSQGVASESEMLLLDWVSLSAPRWRVNPIEGVVLTALAALALTSVLVLGFVYDRPFAQGLALLAVPLALLAVLRFRLAGKLAAIVRAAEARQLDATQASGQAAAAITAHMRLTHLLSLIAIAGAAVWGSLWLALHPNGL